LSGDPPFDDVMYLVSADGSIGYPIYDWSNITNQSISNINAWEYGYGIN
jgi:hypothetical protein